MPGPTARQCDKPNCTRSPEKTYTGPNDNDLRLCGRCYYRLVTKGRSETDPLWLGADPIIRGTTDVGVPEDELGRIPEPHGPPIMRPDPDEISDSGELLTGGDGSADLRPE